MNSEGKESDVNHLDKQEKNQSRSKLSSMPGKLVWTLEQSDIKHVETLAYFHLILNNES